MTTGKFSRLDRVSVVLPLLVGGLGGREDFDPGDGLMRSLSTTAASTETNMMKCFHLNPFMYNGISHSYQLEQPISVLRVVWLYFLFLFKF